MKGGREKAYALCRPPSPFPFPPHLPPLLPLPRPAALIFLARPKQIEAYFAEHFPDIVDVMPDYVEDFQRNPASKLVQIRVRPWNYEDKVCRRLDPAHPYSYRTY